MTIGYGGFTKGTVKEANAHIAALEAAIAQIRTELGPIPDFDRDKYLDNPVHQRMHELGLAMDALVTGGAPAKPPAVTPSPSPVVVAPPPASVPAPAPIGAYGLPIQAMTQAQIDALIPALQAGVGTGLSQAQVDRIAGEVKAGIYSISDVALIDSIKYWFYAGGNQAVLKPYLSAIDQRDMATNALLAITDPRVVHVSGILGSTSVVPAPYIPPPASTGDVTTIPGDLVVMGRVSIGAAPRNDIPLGALLHLYGQGDANIYLEGNRLHDTEHQLAGHVSTFFISGNGGDGGLRFLQNYKDGVSEDGIRPVSIFGFDSQGTPSLQTDKPGESVYGQDFWIIVHHDTQTVDLVCPIPGYKLRICQTPAGAGYADSSDIR